MNNSIIPLEYNGVKIQVRESDGFVNMTQMCKDYGKRLDVYMKSQEIKDFIKRLEAKLNSHRSVLVAGNPSSSVIDKKEGRGGGTWGNPLVALEIAKKLDTDFALWAGAHIFVLAKDGKTSLDVDPFDRYLEIMAENYRDINDQLPIDVRFEELESYSHWCLNPED
jgi:hypothetical protein